MPNKITKVHSIPNPKAFIYKKECRHWQANGIGEAYYLYSATGLAGTWYIKAVRAWEDYDALPEVYTCLTLA